MYAKHGLYAPALEPKHQMHDCMCVINKGTFTRLSYNTNNGNDTKWSQYGGTGITLNANMRARNSQHGVGGDPTKLGSWTWTKIGGKDDITFVFVSTYCLCHNPDGMHSVWSQQARYFRGNIDIRVPNVHALFIRDLYKFFADIRNEGNDVVLRTDANVDVRDRKVTKGLMELGMYEVVVSNHGGESVPATCATNKQREPIDSIWTSFGLTVLRCSFLTFHNVYSFQSDHRLIWANICNEDMLGHQPQCNYRAPRSKVRSNYPDIRKKYIQRCLEKYGYKDVINDFQTLVSFCQQTRDSKDTPNEIICLHASLTTKIEKI